MVGCRPGGDLSDPSDIQSAQDPPAQPARLRVYSRSHKVHQREIVTLNPDDARARAINTGDIVRLFNQRGSCLAAAKVSTELRKGVAQLPTGAWYDPLEPGVIGSLCKHGNPNVLTPDIGTSKLAQGPSAHSCLVQIERTEEELPAVTAFIPPEVIRQS